MNGGGRNRARILVYQEKCLVHQAKRTYTPQNGGHVGETWYTSTEVSTIPSMINQVEMALLAVYRPGRKKHDMAAEERARWIVGSRTLENYLYHCCHWVTWAREALGIRRLVDAQLGAQAWVQQMIDDGRSAWTVSAAISALRKLEAGIRHRWGRDVLLIAPDALVARRRRRLDQRVRRGAYPLPDYFALREQLTGPILGAVEAMYALGLRRHEVIAVKAGDVNLAAAAYAVKEASGDWTPHPLPLGYGGVVTVRRGKGGRPRQVAVPDWYTDTLRACLTDSDGPDSRLWPVQAIALGEAILEACRQARIISRGAHGLRHTWALNRYHDLCALGLSDPEARQIVSWWLGHNRLAVTTSYIPRKAAT